ncbi:MAG: methyltransferase domain-containing protein [Bacteroidia bacterium]
MNLKERSRKEELLDQPGIGTADLHQNLKELDAINKLLGGHAATLKGLKQIIGKRKHKIWRIIDLGCGGGDSLRAIANWAKKRNIKVDLTGIDLLEDAISYAEQTSKGYDIKYLQSDFNDVKSGEYDIAISSLFCHHLYDDNLKALIATKLRLAQFAIINDLHRHFLAYYSIKALTAIFSRSHLVKHDACLSVARGFKNYDLQGLMNEINASYQIEWVWAFRWLVVMEKGA